MKKNNKKIWTIWDNNQSYDEWKENMINDGYEDEELSYDFFCDDLSEQLNCERLNLNINVDGYIVVFANMGLWNGKHNGAGIIGTNVKDILYSECDYVHWYCDRYNVRCDAAHHDGTNHYLYRVAKDKETAERLIDKIVYNGITEEQFRKATRSLRPYIAKVYGW